MRAPGIRWLAVGLVAVAFAAVGSDRAAATTILFFDNFDRNGALNGSSVPTVDSAVYPSGLTWRSSANNSTTTANGGQTGGWNAALTFVPQAGKQYQFTLNAGPTIGSALAIAFGNHAGGFPGAFDGLRQAVSNMQWARIGSNPAFNTYGPVSGGTPQNQVSYTLPSGSGPGFATTLDLLLDTSSGLSAAQVTYRINGGTIGSWSADVSSYNAVLFGRGLFGGEGGSDPSGNATVSDVTLTVVPEPGVLVSAVCGGAFGLAMGRRARRKAVAAA